jgi:hypothetical protein
MEMQTKGKTVVWLEQIQIVYIFVPYIIYSVDQLHKEKHKTKTVNAKTITKNDEIDAIYRDEFEILLNIDKFLNI